MKLKLVCKCKNCGEIAEISSLILDDKGYSTCFYEYKCYHCGISGKAHMKETYWRNEYEN